MREIVIPAAVLRQYVTGGIRGVALEVPVAVNWPELRLTEEQVFANAVAFAWGQPEPFPDHSVFSVTLPYIEELVRP